MGLQTSKNIETKKILLLGYPKSGNTWLGYLLSFLLNAEYLEPYRLMTGLTHSKSRDVLRSTSGLLEDRPRTIYDAVIKSHHLPPAAEERKRFFQLTDKIILIVRDPRDVAVSKYHYDKMFKERTRTGICTTMHISFFRTMRNWTRHNTIWLDENPFVVRYEDLKQNGHATLMALLCYLDVEIDGSLIDAALARFSLANLKGPSESDFSFRFFRKGIVGDHANHFGRIDHLICGMTCRQLARRLGYDL